MEMPTANGLFEFVKSIKRANYNCRDIINGRLLNGLDEDICLNRACPFYKLHNCGSSTPVHANLFEMRKKLVDNYIKNYINARASHETCTMSIIVAPELLESIGFKEKTKDIINQLLMHEIALNTAVDNIAKLLKGEK